jgi:hypothetical protein
MGSNLSPSFTSDKSISRRSAIQVSQDFRASANSIEHSSGQSHDQEHTQAATKEGRVVSSLVNYTESDAWPQGRLAVD